MKRTTYILSLMALLLSAFGMQSANAQEEQYAIYNYRNDGDFNAFLNIDIDSITYSYIGLDSVKYDDIVVQEVWTHDSLYRIPIAAIDSIGFRAPKPQFKEGVFHITDAHLPYTVNVEELAVTFDLTTPIYLIPQVGQVVVSDVYDVPFDEGFAGKVIGVNVQGNGIRVVCEEITLDDVYDQLICVGKSVGYAEDEEQVAARRKVKIDKDGTWEVSLQPITFSLSQKEMDADVSPTGEHINEASNILEVEATPSLSVDYTILHNVKGKENVYKFILHKQLDVNVGINFEKNIWKPINKEKWSDAYIPIPTGIAGVRSKICWGVFLDLEGTARFAVNFPFTLRENIGYDSQDKTLGGIVYNYKGTKMDMPEMAVSLNGMVHFGMAAKFVTCLVAERLANVNFKVKAGPRVSGTIEVSTSGITGDGWSWYEAMKDTKLTFDPLALSISGGVDLVGFEHEWEFTTAPFPPLEFYLFPEFGYHNLTGYDPNNQKARIETKCERNLLLPVKIGAQLQAEDGTTSTIMQEKRHWADWKISEVTLDPHTTYTTEFTNLTDNTNYTSKPVFELLGHQFVVDPKVSFGTNIENVELYEGEQVELKNLKLAGVPRNLVVINNHPNVATCKLTAIKTLIVEAISEGTANVTIKDTKENTFRFVCITVKKKEIPADLELATLSVSLNENETTTVEIVSGNGDYTLSDYDVAIVRASVEEGIITLTGLKEGNTRIVVKDNKTGQTQVIVVTVGKVLGDHAVVDLGLPSGTLWATCNIGATVPEGYGDYFAWGEKDTKSVFNWGNYTYCSGTSSSCQDIGADIAGTEFDAARANWGSAWSMPTENQFKELITNTTSKWTFINGVGGRLFTATNGNSIFLPAGGNVWSTDGLYEKGEYGYYWSSTQHATKIHSAIYLGFDAYNGAWTTANYRGRGFSVRPVTKKQ